MTQILAPPERSNAARTDDRPWSLYSRKQIIQVKTTAAISRYGAMAIEGSRSLSFICQVGSSLTGAVVDYSVLYRRLRHVEGYAQIPAYLQDCRLQRRCQQMDSKPGGAVEADWNQKGDTSSSTANQIGYQLAGSQDTLK